MVFPTSTCHTVLRTVPIINDPNIGIILAMLVKLILNKVLRKVTTDIRLTAAETFKTISLAYSLATSDQLSN
tara:strand:+ start:232 stop:447 length:216 start_codon:yes stop_codon:yes gene_type:complete